jgi:hypothetical protein
VICRNPSRQRRLSLVRADRLAVAADPQLATLLTRSLADGALHVAIAALAVLLMLNMVVRQ